MPDGRTVVALLFRTHLSVSSREEAD